MSEAFDVIGPQGGPVQPVATSLAHRPADPNRFVFDETVVPIFDDMAARSIPGYKAFFDHVTRLVAGRPLPKWSQVWDMGVTTGAGLAAVKRATFHPYVEWFGVDISQPMLDRAGQNCPYATMIQHDFQNGLDALPIERGGVSVMLWNWTLQFVTPQLAEREALLRAAAEVLHKDGMIFVGEKYRDRDERIHEAMEAAYYTWRMDNGYAAREIKAKSGALSGSMWPWTHEDLVRVAESCGLRVTPLYRMFNFGGYVLTR